MRPYRLRRLSFECFFLALVIFATHLSLGVSTANGGAASTKVSVAYTTVGGILTPIWIPVEKKIFEKYGLDVSMKFVSTGPVVVSALMAGEIDVAAAAGEPIVAGILGGAELTIIGFGAVTTPLSLFVVPAISNFEQLKGATLAVSRLTSSGAYMLKVGLRKHGLEPFKDVTLIQVGGIPESLAALQTGKVQGAMLSPPTTYRAESGGFKRLWNALGVEYPSLVIATRKSYLKGSQI